MESELNCIELALCINKPQWSEQDKALIMCSCCESTEKETDNPVRCLQSHFFIHLEMNVSLHPSLYIHEGPLTICRDHFPFHPHCQCRLKEKSP